MRILPQQSRIVVEPIPDDSKIIIPEGFKDEDGNEHPRPIRWRIVAVGAGRTLENGTVIPIPLEVGDEVVFYGNGAVRLEPRAFYGDRILQVVDYAYVVGKVERDPGEVVSFVPPARKIVAAQIVQ